MIMSKMKETRNAFFCIENFPLRRLSAIKFRPDSRDCNRQLMIEPKRFLEWPGTAGSPLALPSSIIKKLTCHRGEPVLQEEKFLSGKDSLFRAATMIIQKKAAGRLPAAETVSKSDSIIIFLGLVRLRIFKFNS